MTRPFKLGIALASWARSNLVKLAPANAGKCEAVDKRTLEELVAAPFIQIERDDEFTLSARAYGRCPDLCVNTNV